MICCEHGVTLTCDDCPDRDQAERTARIAARINAARADGTACEQCDGNGRIIVRGLTKVCGECGGNGLSRRAAEDLARSSGDLEEGITLTKVSA